MESGLANVLEVAEFPTRQRLLARIPELLEHLLRINGTRGELVVLLLPDRIHQSL